MIDTMALIRALNKVKHDIAHLTDILLAELKNNPSPVTGGVSENDIIRQYNEDLKCAKKQLEKEWLQSPQHMLTVGSRRTDFHTSAGCSMCRGMGFSVRTRSGIEHSMIWEDSIPISTVGA